MLSSGKKIVLVILLTLLFLDACVEIGLTAAALNYINNAPRYYTYTTGVYPYDTDARRTVNLTGNPGFNLIPLNLSLASGVIVITLVCGLGFLLVLLRTKPRSDATKSRDATVFGNNRKWLFLALALAIIVTADVGYTFTVADQALKRSYVSSYSGVDRLDDNGIYPEGWFQDIAELPDFSAVGEANYQQALNRAWRFNLAPLIVLSWFTLFVAVSDAADEDIPKTAEQDKAAQLEMQSRQTSV